MNDKTESNAINEAMEMLYQYGLSGVGPAMMILINEAIKIQRETISYENSCEQLIEI